MQPSLAGPKRPQDLVALSAAKAGFAKELPGLNAGKLEAGKEVAIAGADYKLQHGNVVLAAITSCTNTSNPYVMMGAGLSRKKRQHLA